MAPTASTRELGRHLLFPALVLLAFSLSYPALSSSAAETKTITYTSLSTITEGTTNATITIIQFATTVHVTANMTRTVTRYVSTTTVFVDVRYGVTKAPRVVYHHTTVTVPQTATLTDKVFVQTTFCEGTLTTYAPLPLVVDEDVDVRRAADERILMMSLCIVALVAVVALALAGRPKCGALIGYLGLTCSPLHSYSFLSSS